VPYVTHCFKAVVQHEQLPSEIPVLPEVPVEVPGEVESSRRVVKGPPEDPGMQLIDFR
jgi:hypothetical protein